VKKLLVVAGYSGYYDHKYNTLNNVDPTQYYTGSQFDGQAFTLSANYGLPIGNNGGFIKYRGKPAHTREDIQGIAGHELVHKSKF